MLNSKKVSLSQASAAISAAALTTIDSNSNYNLLNITTTDEHNFFAGAQVNINGVTAAYSTAIQAIQTGYRTTSSSSAATGYVRFRVSGSRANQFKTGDFVSTTGNTSGYNFTNYPIVWSGASQGYWYFTVLLATTTTPAAYGTASSSLGPFNNYTIYQILGPKSFTIKLDRAFTSTAQATVSVTTGATANLINGSLSSLDLRYAQPTL
jgi:hypothetical protein